MDNIEEALERALRDIKKAYREEIALISREKANEEIREENNELRKRYNLKYLECRNLQVAGTQLIDLLSDHNIQVPPDLFEAFYPKNPNQG